MFGIAGWVCCGLVRLKDNEPYYNVKWVSWIAHLNEIHWMEGKWVDPVVWHHIFFKEIMLEKEMIGALNSTSVLLQVKEGELTAEKQIKCWARNKSN